MKIHSDAVVTDCIPHLRTQIYLSANFPGNIQPYASAIFC